MVVFFKQKTAYERRISDWSSDVCSSDLNETIGRIAAELADRSRPFCHDVVSNARAVLAELELAVEVARGRYLTVDERFQAAVHHDGAQIDRKSVVLGKRVSVRVYLGGRRIIKTKTKKKT